MDPQTKLENPDLKPGSLAFRPINSTSFLCCTELHCLTQKHALQHADVLPDPNSNRNVHLPNTSRLVFVLRDFLKPPRFIPMRILWRTAVINPFLLAWRLREAWTKPRSLPHSQRMGLGLNNLTPESTGEAHFQGTLAWNPFNVTMRKGVCFHNGLALWSSDPHPSKVTSQRPLRPPKP